MDFWFWVKTKNMLVVEFCS